MPNNCFLTSMVSFPFDVFALFVHLTAFTFAAFVGAASLLVLRLWHSGASLQGRASRDKAGAEGSSTEVAAVDDPQARSIRLIRQVAADEVICEFLKNEFYHPDFDRGRQEVTRLVLQPDLQNDMENQQRRELFFRKRGGMWRELPRDTQWCEVELTNDNLDQIRIFPRADWRRFAQDGFGLTKIAGRIREAIRRTPEVPFLADIESLSRKLPNESGESAVLLIGLNDRDPLTILEGNHRMVAALLASTPVLERFRFFCGLSAGMHRCCWYRTSLIGLAHYAGNLVRDFGQIRHSDVARVLPRRKALAGTAAILTHRATLPLTAAAPTLPPNKDN